MGADQRYYVINYLFWDYQSDYLSRGLKVTPFTELVGCSFRLVSGTESPYHFRLCSDCHIFESVK